MRPHKDVFVVVKVCENVQNTEFIRFHHECQHLRPALIEISNDGGRLPWEYF